MRSSFPFLVLRGALLLLLVLALPVGAQRAFGRDVPAPVSARDGGLLRLLIVPTVSTHELRLYGPCVEDGRALADPLVAGMRSPWATRPTGSEQMAWRFRLPDDGVYTAYFRVESTFARFDAALVWDLAEFPQSSQDKRMFDGACYGLIPGLAVFAAEPLMSKDVRSWSE